MGNDLVNISLTEKEINFCKKLTEKIINSKEIPYSRKKHKILPQFDAHFAGVLGEAAFAKYHGVKINREIYSRGDNHLPDVILKDGRGIEVKCSKYSGDNPHLILIEEELIAKWICLVQKINESDFRIYPIISGELFREHAVIKDWGYGDRYSLGGKKIISLCNNGKPEIDKDWLNDYDREWIRQTEFSG